MEAIFISFNQAHYDDIIELLNKSHIKGFTSWESVTGQGSKDGEPHLGSHAWPTMNSALMVFVESSTKAKSFMEALSKLDKEFERQGLRAFRWEIKDTI